MENWCELQFIQHNANGTVLKQTIKYAELSFFERRVINELLNTKGGEISEFKTEVD